MAWPPTTHQDVQDAVSTLRGVAYNVKDYGATGNGTTDDTTAVQNAINAAQTGGGQVFVPPGTYLVGPLTITSDVAIRGTGWGSKLRLKNASNGYLLTLSPASGAYISVDVAHLTIDGNAGNQTSGGCVDGAGSVQSRFDNIHFTAAYDVCLWLHSNAQGGYGHHNRVTRCLFDGLNSISGANQQGIRMQASDENYVAFCDFENWGGLPATPGSEPYAIKDWAGIQVITANVFVGGQEAVRIQDASSTRVVSNTFDGVGRSGVHASGSKNVIASNLFSNGSSASTGAWGQCEIDNSSSAVINGNIFAVTTTGVVRNCVREYSTSSNKTLVSNNVIDLSGGSLYGTNTAIELFGANSVAVNNIT